MTVESSSSSSGVKKSILLPTFGSSQAFVDISSKSSDNSSTNSSNNGQSVFGNNIQKKQGTYA